MVPSLPFPQVLGMLFGPPRFTFNLDLYRQLIRERGPGRQPLPPGKEPEVTFTMGPLDGTLGAYNLKTRRLTVDVLENLFVSMMSSDIHGPEDLKRRFDDRMTQTLAHEGGHWHLQKRFGLLSVLDKVVLIAVLSLLGLVGTWGVLRFFIRVLALRWIAGMWHLSPVGGVLLALVLLFAYGWLVMNLVRLYRTVWLGLVFAATYQICITERFARRFEQRPAHDPKWDDVIKVP